LVEEAHKKKKPWLPADWVANHTSWDNDWITTHLGIKDARGNIIIPPEIIIMMSHN
jgi:hypothetical protein